MTLSIPSRRGFLGGLAATLGGLIAAPAIVRATSLMPISQRALLVPTAEFVAAFDTADTMSYLYWVAMGGSIVKRSARDIMSAPPGVYQPWLPTGVGDSVEFRPVNVERSGLKMTPEHIRGIRPSQDEWSPRPDDFVAHERERLAAERERLSRELARVSRLSKLRSIS